MGEAADVLESLGGIEVERSIAPFYHKTVERLSSVAGIKKPTLYLINDDTPNACAVGLDSGDTAIGINTGLLRDFDENEIEGVIAHEISHISKGHTIEKTKVAMRALAIAQAGAVIGGGIITSDIDFTPDDGDSGDIVSMGLKVLLGAAASGIGSAIGSKWLTEYSFKSEFEADSFGAFLTGKPWALSNALKKLEFFTSLGSRKYSPEVSQLFIIGPSYLEHKTHPSTYDRVSQLLSLNVKAPEIAGIPTIFCSTCGDKTDADGKHCSWCGSSLDE